MYSEDSGFGLLGIAPLAQGYRRQSLRRYNLRTTGALLSEACGFGLLSIEPLAQVFLGWEAEPPYSAVRRYNLRTTALAVGNGFFDEKISQPAG
jgi:hypothetical protein